jgi:hypothetical protein
MGFRIRYIKNIDSNLTYPLLRDHRSRRPRRYPPLLIKCPKCQARLTFHRALIPLMDSCGFESYSLECGACAVVFAGIIDPYDEALLLSGHACDGQGAAGSGGDNWSGSIYGEQALTGRP